jgi:hypothetical protein
MHGCLAYLIKVLYVMEYSRMRAAREWLDADTDTIHSRDQA